MIHDENSYITQARCALVEAEVGDVTIRYVDRRCISIYHYISKAGRHIVSGAIITSGWIELKPDIIIGLTVCLIVVFTMNIGQASIVQKTRK